MSGVDEERRGGGRGERGGSAPPNSNRPLDPPSLLPPVSTLALLTAAWLLATETSSYIRPPLEQSVGVDPPHRRHDLLRVTFDVAFPSMPCHALHVDTFDSRAMPPPTPGAASTAAAWRVEGVPAAPRARGRSTKRASATTATRFAPPSTCPPPTTRCGWAGLRLRRLLSMAPL